MSSMTTKFVLIMMLFADVCLSHVRDVWCLWLVEEEEEEQEQEQERRRRRKEFTYYSD